MKPVLTAAELAMLDARAVETVPIEALVARAGHALARHAMALLGPPYGRRVLVVAGHGHNGDDGRVAARLLVRRGVRVRLVEPGELVEVPGGTDLVLDAAYGTGFRGRYDAPANPAGVPVLAVDIASGLRADTGEAEGHPLPARRTVTFAALKPGLFLNDGPELSGEVALEPIGLAPESSTLSLVEDGDLVAIPERGRRAHKWNAATFVLAGSPGMLGAAALAASAALRAGSGMVRLGSPGAVPGAVPVTEAVAVELGEEGFAPDVLAQLERCKALVCGPGLGLGAGRAAAVAEILSRSEVPAVLDADALTLLGDTPRAAALLAAAGAPVVLTPHEGEFARLAGGPPGVDRVAAVRELAASLGATVLLKGATTVVADPGGEALLVTAGTPALATAGTGDVLSGVIGALLAQGLPPLLAAGIGAHVHGRAARAGRSRGLVASDLPALVAAVLSGAGLP